MIHIVALYFSIHSSIIHNSFLIHFDTQLLDHSCQCQLILPAIIQLMPIACLYLQLLFFIESRALAGFNWLPLLPWQWCWQINFHLIGLSAPMRHLYSCRSYMYVHLYAIKLFMCTYRHLVGRSVELLNQSCLSVPHKCYEVSIYIHSWSLWWCQL